MEIRYNEDVEKTRDQQFPMLQDGIYLDHAGSTVASKSLIDSFASEMTSVLYGNPHSGSLPSQRSTDQIENVRLQLMDFVGADVHDYDLVFVANATAGIKMVLDGLRHVPDGFNYAYHEACHTSVVGVGEEAVESVCVSDRQVQQWRQGVSPFSGTTRTMLFSYTAQSHLNGQRYPLSWPKGIANENTYTLLDAASFAATSRLDMSHPDFAADFVVLSLYKIFGFPDLGVLLVRKGVTLLDQRKYFGGGTVDMVICAEKWHARKPNLHERLEDGTLPFHNIIAAGLALKTHASLFGSMDSVSQHTAYLTQRLHHGLASLRHGNGHQVCTLYTAPDHGPIVSFNIQSSRGAWIALGEFEKLAIVQKVHVRTGGVCSPGGIAAVLDLQPWEMKRNFYAGLRCGVENDFSDKPVGVIRASLGAMSIKSDVDRFLGFVREFFVEETNQSILPAMTTETALSVKEITVYPIKSCGGYAVSGPWAVRPEGLAWDREWCLLHRGSGQALNQKRYPRMALLRPALDFKAGLLRVYYDDSQVSVPLADSQDYRWRKSRVCGEEITAQTYKSEEINSFFSEALGVSCVLARFPPGGRGLGSRQNKAKMQKHQPDFRLPTPPNSDSEHNILLANESPILMIHVASLDALNKAIAERGGRPATTASFRANIVLEGNRHPAYSEDAWRKLRIGMQRFTLLGACRRCQMVCIDQGTGEQGQEPLATLSKTRRLDGKIYFGAHMKHDGATQNSTICVGDHVFID